MENETGATTPQAEPKATPDATPKQEFKTIKINERTGFKVPADFPDLPDNIKNSISEKDQTIGKLMREKKLYEQQLEQVRQQQQTTPTQRPDPLDDPDGYENYILNRVTDHHKNLQNMNRTTASELSFLKDEAAKDVQLPEGYASVDELKLKDATAFENYQKAVNQRYEDVLFYMREEGLLDAKDGSVIIGKGNARRAYRDYYFDDIVRRQRATGMKEAQETLNKGASAASHLAGNKSGGGQKQTYEDLRKKDPKAAQKLLDDMMRKEFG